MSCPKCAEMCAGLKGGQADGSVDDGRNSVPLLCGPRGQLPPKFPKLHPPTCSSAARIPTSAKRDHCPKRKRVKSCSRVCCSAGCTQSTAETGKESPRTNAVKVSRGELRRQWRRAPRASSYGLELQANRLLAARSSWLAALKAGTAPDITRSAAPRRDRGWQLATRESARSARRRPATPASKS